MWRRRAHDPYVRFPQHSRRSAAQAGPLKPDCPDLKSGESRLNGRYVGKIGHLIVTLPLNGGALANLCNVSALHAYAETRYPSPRCLWRRPLRLALACTYSKTGTSKGYIYV